MTYSDMYVASDRIAEVKLREAAEKMARDGHTSTLHKHPKDAVCNGGCELIEPPGTSGR